MFGNRRDHLFVIMNEQGVVAEVFPSIQGEGPWVGQLQLFIRLAGCTFGCQYCDTKWAQSFHLDKLIICSNPFRINQTTSTNPVSVTTLLGILESVLKKHGSVQSIALTGGEPLEQIGFVKMLLKKLRTNYPGLPVMLETNGVHVDALTLVKSLVQTISMDIKLPSTSGQPFAAEKIEQFLKLASTKQGWVKVVVSEATTGREIVKVAKLMCSIVPKWDLVLQPIATKGRTFRVDNHYYQLLQKAFVYHDKVRLVPQLHKMLNIA